MASCRTVRQVKHGERLRRSQNSLIPPISTPDKSLVGNCKLPFTCETLVEVDGYGPYKPVPPPKPLPQQNSSSAPPPPYRMPPYPLFNEPSIPGATGLESSGNLSNSQGLQTHSSKFPIEREVILSSADKNSKIPILQEYKKRSKSAIAPDIPPKQMAAWTQAQRQMTLQSQVLNPDQIHPAHIHQTQQNNLHNGVDQTGLYRSPYLSVSDFYNGQNTGAVPRSTWQGGEVRPSPAPRQYPQSDDNQTNSPNVAISIETAKDNNQKETPKSSKSVTKTYHTIKDLISNRFRSGKENSDEKMDEPGLNNVTDELRKSARSIDRLGDEYSDELTNNFKKTVGDQGIYGKPRTEPNLNMQQQHHYNQQMMQQHLLSQPAPQSRQTAQQYQLAQQLKGQGQNFYPNHQLTQARSQEILAPCTPEQIYYQSPYGSAAQRPMQRYGMSQGSEQNYILMHHSQLDEREMQNERFLDDRRPNVEKRSAQQLERDNLRQRSFETRRTASQPQLACDDEVTAETTTNHPYPHLVSAHARRGSHGNLIETIGAANENEKDSDDGGFLKRTTDRQEKEGSDLQIPDTSTGPNTTDTQESSGYNDSKISDALMGSPRKRLEGEIGRIEGVYNIGQKPIKPKTDKKMTGESGASSDYDKPGQSSSNADSGRGSAAYSSGRRPGTKGIQESPELHRNKTNFKDLYHSSQDSEWVDVVENELRTILEPKLHELSLQGNSVGISNSTLSESISSMTPPLPPLSPGEQSSPNLTPRNSAKFKKHSSLPYGSKPDYGHETYNKLHKGHAVGTGRWSNATPQKQRNKKIDHNAAFRAKQAFGFDNTDIASTTTRSLDLESMLDNQSDSEGDISTTDARAIRKQLESLEGMYSEVLKILGVKKHMGRYQPSDPRFSKRRYGSMSSLPSSSVSSRPIRDKRRANEDRKKVKDIRGINKRFQRLESHVVTLARSVAHLSSEMRTQHLMIQEMETIRGEISALRTQTNMLNVRSQSATRAANGSKDLPNLTNPTRVKKLTKFFGDEPPLLRLFLRKLGYEKYANVFENERVGMVELPYLSEERLQKMGVPLGPRLRILQEAQISVCKDTTLCIV
ncbi:uncharacterized protein LOC116167798 isoform X2 [Photinus pyralis]|uniref:uncharacterized protein LOC116167798 isoform X2 n=1 Tax=Photinus pyralis TaxID=7054 RepID=UPI0012676288|nr:uncharacterized protein LOC116167798 isoform X2 [Photinus pyralis]XP_031339188.1 uncharacterized protein LOC116167798 isoform X2 [Photinus pyralis]